MFTIRTILHPTDYSGLARHAYEVAYSLARDYGARLVVVHVVEKTRALEGATVVVLPHPCPPVIVGDGLTQGGREAFEARLRDLYPPAAEVPVETRLREGIPAEEILRLADEIDCDLIVMATHGRTGLERALMGSVAEAVVRRSSRPVLTVRSPSPRSAAGEEPGDASIGEGSRSHRGEFVNPFHP